ncbi:MAG TPA: cation diffusion facilitator family transporter [Lacipirellulaceae bacterium]|jgi:cation diffusion facilitator family transporter|nr:cation diffusion facilitator family transporter [Lacipirellulaceae bacterium]
MSHLPSQTDAILSKLDQSAATGIRASLGGVLVSVLLGAIKIVAGILGNSYALLADGVESMLDVFSGLVVAGSLKIAVQPPDERYPFGRGKIEPAAALAIATALLATATGIAIQSVREIRMPLPSRPAAFTLVVLILVVIVKEFLYRYLLRTSNSIDSQAMRTDAWHHRSDSLTSLAAFIGISIALLGNESYRSADAWAALFAAAVIAANGALLLRNSWREILDVSPPDRIVEDIRKIAKRVDGVAGIDMCRVRKSGLGLWVDIHVEVRGDMSVRDGHTIAHRVKDALLASNHNVMDALVHIEPMRDDAGPQKV